MKKTLHLEQSYLSLPKQLFSRIEPYNNQKSTISLLNEDLITELKLDKKYFLSEEGTLFLSGSTNINGDLFSQAYSGHQYGHFTTLGDGRAMMLGELIVDERRLDVQLKGSGTTPYSRRGDGKATLYSMLREYLISEAMHHLKVPTTRSLAVLNTNQKVTRIKQEVGGMLCRVASSHIRVGTFEFANATNDKDLMKELADYTINRHYHELNNKKNKYQLFLREVIKKQASLISKWMSLGFVHGVMNTDNMTISGETIDYGPCAFLDTYNPGKSFSSIDQNGRYSYKNQPYIGSWNLMKFAESILLLLDENIKSAVEIANEELKQYEGYFKESYYDIFSKKIGIKDPTSEDKHLVDELLLIMEKNQADFTNTFRVLTLDQYEKLPFYKTEEWKIWFQKWTRQLGYRKLEPKVRINIMEQHNPTLIPRNHLVEEALLEASENNNFNFFHKLLDQLKNPYNYTISHTDKYLEPIESDEDYITYCGT